MICSSYSAPPNAKFLISLRPVGENSLDYIRKAGIRPKGEEKPATATTSPSPFPPSDLAKA
jgi:hypothetical protein